MTQMKSNRCQGSFDAFMNELISKASFEPFKGAFRRAMFLCQRTSLYKAIFLAKSDFLDTLYTLTDMY